jgi:hypothetical protein
MPITAIEGKPLAQLTSRASSTPCEEACSVGFATLELLWKPFLHSPPLLADTLPALPEEHDNDSGVGSASAYLLHILWIGVWTDGFGD